jgi:hypothetical protein
MKVVFERDKDTPKKVRFSLNEGPIVGNIYVAKDDVDKYSKDGKLEVEIPEVPA